jgi:hypothetical protein
MTELVTSLVGLVETPAAMPIIKESLAIAPAIPINISTMVPTSCSTELVAQAIADVPSVTSKVPPVFYLNECPDRDTNIICVAALVMVSSINQP